jgi:hypothetical protein
MESAEVGYVFSSTCGRVCFARGAWLYCQCFACESGRMRGMGGDGGEEIVDFFIVDFVI